MSVELGFHLFYTQQFEVILQLLFSDLKVGGLMVESMVKLVVELMVEMP